MRKIYLLLVSVTMAMMANAQITITVTGNTNTTPNLTATYASLAAALTDLNLVTAMTGPVVLTCDAGTSETAPVKGFVLGSATLNPVLSSTNTITINKSGGTVTINAAVGTANGPSASPDGMLYLNGADYVTIDGLTFTDGNAASAIVAMEFGIALFKFSAGDGCNNNTIQNCTFNMQRINNNAGAAPMLDGSWAIEVLNSTAAAANVALTPTNGGTLATNGTNSGNRFYTNAINNGNAGIGFGGYAATLGVGPAPVATTFLGDLGNDVGGVAPGTGNTILNYGGGAATSPAAGIRANNQWSINIRYNTINNNNGAGVNHATTLRGIYAQAGTSANATINNNTVTLQSGATTSIASAIDNAIGSTAAANTVTINNNTVNIAYATATTGVCNGIINSSTAATVNINSNIIQGVAATTLAGTGTHVMIETGSPATATANSNLITLISRSGASGSWRGIKMTSPANITINSNTIDGLSWTTVTSTGSIDGIYGISSAVNVTASSNIIRNLSTPTTGTITGINEFGVSGLKTYQNNQIYNFTTTAGGAGGASMRGISESTGSTNTYSGNIIYALNSTGTTGGTGGTIVGITFSSGTTNNVSNNAIYDLSSTSTNPVVTGINIGGGTTSNISNNLIGDLRATVSTGNVSISGITAASGTTNNIFHNTVNISSTTASVTTFGTSAIYFSSSTPVNNLRNNIFVNTSAPGPTGGFTAAIRYTIAPTSTNFPAANNNNFYYAGVAAANRVLYCEGSSAAPTNGQQTIAAYKTYISITLPVAGRESASVSEIPNFVSTTGSNPITTFLQYNTGIATQIEQGGLLGTGISTDYAGTTRCPGGGCPGAAATPDMGAWELNGIPLDLSGPSISYTSFGNTSCLADRTLSPVTITDGSGVNITAGTRPRLYYRKTTNANTYVDNTAGTDGWKYVEATGVGGSPFSFTTDYSLLFGGAPITLDVIQYFVVAQDNAGTPNVGINAGTFTLAPSSVALAAANFPVTGANSYTLVAAGYSGTLNVGPTETITTLTAAGGLFSLINTNGLSGNLVVTITGNIITEDGVNALNAINYNACAAGPFTLTIKPSGTFTVSGTSATALIRLNDADYVIIDGSSTGASAAACLVGGNAAIRELTIQNTNVGTSAVVISVGSGTNGAQNNTIKNVNILGQDPTTTLIGISMGGTTPGTIGTDNDNNRVENCSVKRAIFGIYSAGASLANQNTGTVITKNDLSALTTDRIRRVGIIVFFENGVQITENSVAVETNESADGIGIAVGTQGIDATNTTSGGVTNALVSKNKINGIASLSAVGFSAAGITVAGAAGGANTIQNNMITGVTAPATSPDIVAGIYVVGAAGSDTRLYYNSISMTGDRGTVATQMPGYGIAITGTDPTVDLRDNILYTTQIASGGGVNAKSYAIGMVSTTFVNLNSNYNDFWSTGANDGGFRTGSLGAAAGTDYATVALWAAAVSDDANSLEVLPVFVNDLNDLHLTTANCGLDGRGVPIAGITDDYDCNVRNTGAPDMGADEFTAVSGTTLAVTVPGTTDNVTYNVSPTGTVFSNSTCGILDGIIPNGGSPVSGLITSKVTIDLTVQTYSTHAYLQRHFDITPAVNQTTATARVTLYVLQSEFDAYNLANGADPDLPTTPGDAPGISNLRVIKYSGNGTAPGTYVPGVATQINPSDADIVWDGVNSWWTITFDVTGFSGFYIAGSFGSLPVTILNFSGYKDGSRNQLRWTTASESNNSGFEMQRSTDGTNYSALGFVNTQALGGNSVSQLNYAFTDNNVIGSKQYYRLRQVNFDGNSKLSNIVLIKGDKPVTLMIDGLFPNPASTLVNVLIAAPNKDKVTMLVTDIAGRIVIQKAVNVETGSNTIPVDITALSSGTYMVKLVCSSNCETAVGKFVKQ